ncbi:MAG: glycosyltransferase family 39 protein, partial [Polyangiaceae bacterium]|nr:glycosyltransferase family 39 protein [Polyangiaceae bacterium]
MTSEPSAPRTGGDIPAPTSSRGSPPQKAANAPNSSNSGDPDPSAAEDAPPTDSAASNTANTANASAANVESGVSCDAACKCPGNPWVLRVIGFAIPILIFFPFLGSGGIWDPHELNVADLSRRIALNLFGTQSLSDSSAVDAASNAMPTLEQLGKGELPFTSIAAGFAAFGLHEWAGRLPLALWALAGIAAAYWLVTRLMDERAGLFTCIVLATMPLFFVQARTMLGDIVIFSSVIIAIAGLGVLVFDSQASTKTRIAAGILSVIGIAAGFASRGLLLGVAVPLLTVGLAWAVLILSTSSPKPTRFPLIIGASCTAIGAICAAWASYTLITVEADNGVRILGTLVARQSQPPSFDQTILVLGHALFPWSAFIPFAIGRLFRPGILLTDNQASRERGLRVIVVLGSCLSFGAAGLMTPFANNIPFVGVALLAAIAAIVIRDLERGAHASRTLALGTVAFVMLFFRDFRMWPDKALSAFMVNSPSFPDSFKHSATNLMLGCT